MYSALSRASIKIPLISNTDELEIELELELDKLLLEGRSEELDSPAKLELLEEVAPSKELDPLSSTLEEEMSIDDEDGALEEEMSIDDNDDELEEESDSELFSIASEDFAEEEFSNESSASLLEELVSGDVPDSEQPQIDKLTTAIQTAIRENPFISLRTTSANSLFD